MSNLTIDTASARELANWDLFVEGACNGTIFHRRSFLAYHGDRFHAQERFIVVRKGEAIKAQMPLAVQTDDQTGHKTARSPYGGSFGGLIFAEQPGYSFSRDVAGLLKQWMKAEGVQSLTMTPPTSICARQHSDTFAFALLETGFTSVNRDVCSVVPLNVPDRSASANMTANGRNMMRKAVKAGLEIQHDCDVATFYPVLMATYAKHGTDPTHTQEALTWLVEAFPGQIRCHVATLEHYPVAGVCEFALNARVNSAFYFGQRPEHEKSQGLSLLVYDAVERAEKDGYQYYDFGTSSHMMQGRENIFRFKESFGAVGGFRETFQLTLDA